MKNLDPMIVELTERQLFLLTQGKHWSEKKDYLYKLAKQFGLVVNTDEELQYLIEVHCVNERKRLALIEKERERTANNGFDEVLDPQIGHKYHLSWADKGCVFVLKSVDGEYGYFDNPKYKRKTLLRSKLSDIRSLRGR